MSQVAVLKLHGSRAEQLRRAAAARGVSVSAIIDRLIMAEIQADIIRDELPGFDVSGHRRMGPTAPCVRMQFGECPLPDVDPPTAGMVASYLERVAIDRGREASQRIVFSPAFALTIARKGRGVILTTEATEAGESYQATLSFSMVCDLVRIIRREVDYANGIDA